ncbi:DNA alkylation repair protein [Luteolibacter algae]|uniref:DNA alkylation repair protein n=1 Tax=Luteolibacter algae TaxID=454151 RepID=A0ABW5D886_9BACT
MIPKEILNRTGARNTASVPENVLGLLNDGVIETVNLCEWLVVDQLALAEKIFPEHVWSRLLPGLRSDFRKLTPQTAPKKLALVGKYLAAAFPQKSSALRSSQALLSSPSDIVRSWGAYLIGFSKTLSLPEKLTQIRPFAADRNMSTREIAWLALRAEIPGNLEQALSLLSGFVTDPDPSIRRFASELTRPRGVWCSHIPALKEYPEQGFELLEPLRSDSSKYVRDSVGNWLNDASKSAPVSVKTLCDRWEKDSPSPETAYIVKRALRTLSKTS